MRKIFALLLVFVTLHLGAWERQPLWPGLDNMPDRQAHQIAEMTDVSEAPGFNPDEHRMPFIEWYEKPSDPNGACMILISGGGYYNCCDVGLVEMWHRELTALGVQCVKLVYRTSRPEGIPYYRTAWEDGQRAVRMVRSQAALRGFDPEKIRDDGRNHVGLENVRERVRMTAGGDLKIESEPGVGTTVTILLKRRATKE